jgi:hypothetical protein
MAIAKKASLVAFEDSDGLRRHRASFKNKNRLAALTDPPAESTNPATAGFSCTAGQNNIPVADPQKQRSVPRAPAIPELLETWVSQGNT